MVEFVDQLVKSGSISSPATHFWINEFNAFIASNTDATHAGQGGNETFHDQGAAFSQRSLSAMSYIMTTLSSTQTWDVLWILAVRFASM